VEQQRQPEAVAARSADGGDDTQESKLGFEAFVGFIMAGNRSGRFCGGRWRGAVARALPQSWAGWWVWPEG
jgi:hypothetical protein